MDWSEIRVEVAGNYLETVANLFHESGAGGVVVEQGPNSASTVIAYVAMGSRTNTVLGDLELLFKSLELLDASSCTRKVSVRPVAEVDWAEEWKKFYDPVEIGPILIKPSWQECSTQGRIVVELDPGMAFGTGIHPTTQLCIREILRIVQTDTRMLDIGCGSGILAVTAAKLGAASVDAVDLDPVAVRVAKENVKINHCQQAVNVRLQDALAQDSLAGYDLVVANIGFAVANILLESYLARVQSGLMVLSGFPQNRLAGLSQNAREQGLFVRSRFKQGWGCLVLGKI